MMAQLQCKFREQVERRRIFNDQQASPTAWVFDSSHPWQLLGKLP